MGFGSGGVDSSMTDDSRWISVLRSSHDRFAGLVEGLSDEEVTGPSYDDDWTIADVASHLGSQAEIFLPFLEAGLTGDQPPGNDSFAPIWDRWNAMAPADQVRESVARNEEFVRRIEGLDEDERAKLRVPLFGSELDLAGFAAFRLGEHAIHTWDVAVALDPSATVAADAVELLSDGLDTRVGRAGKAVDGAGPLVVETTSPDRLVALDLDPAVTAGPAPAEASADVVLPAEAFVRLVYGRLDPAHTPDSVADTDALTTLRQAFPGF